MRYLHALVFVIWCALAACAAPRGWIQPLDSTLPHIESPQRQLVTFEFREKSFTLQTVLSRGPAGLTLIGLSSVGQRLFTLHYDGQAVSVESRIEQLEESSPFDPRWILTDLQLAHAPLPQLRAALPDDIEVKALGTWRALFRDGELLWMRASETNAAFKSSLLIYNAVIGYQVHIESLMLSFDARE